MGDTGISWTDETWNPIRGCSRVSEGCRHCYAEQQAARIVRMGKGKPTPYDGLVRIGRVPSSNELPSAGSSDDPAWVGAPGARPFAFGGEPRWTGNVVLDPAKLSAPLRWRSPRRIFVNSMSDLFHESLTNEQIAAVFGVMAACPQHTFQILTKRARRMREWYQWVDGWPARTPAELTARAHGPSVRERIEDAMRSALTGVVESTPRRRDSRWPLPNVWLGVSVENQDAADERIPELLATPAAVRFLSCEPLLGQIYLDDVRPQRNGKELCSIDTLRTTTHLFVEDDWSRNHIDWVIAGCESGPGARPCSVGWLRSLRNQCKSAGVPFFLKQAREEIERNGEDVAQVNCGAGSRRKPGGVIELPYLDGQQHAAFPEVRRG